MILIFRKNIYSIIKASSNLDIWNTTKQDGSFNNTVVYLPTDIDKNLSNLDSVIITYNTTDVYNTDGYNGNFSDNNITLVSNTPTYDGYLSAGDIVKVNYDIGNSASLGFDIYEEFKLYGNRISDIHIKDRELGGSSVKLGAGNANFKSFFEVFSKIDFKALLSLNGYEA